MPDPFYINIDTPGRVKINRIVIGGCEILIKESVIMPDHELGFYDARGNLIGKIVNVATKKGSTDDQA